MNPNAIMGIADCELRIADSTWSIQFAIRNSPCLGVSVVMACLQR